MPSTTSRKGSKSCWGFHRGSPAWTGPTRRGRSTASWRNASRFFGRRRSGRRNGRTEGNERTTNDEVGRVGLPEEERDGGPDHESRIFQARNPDQAGKGHYGAILWVKPAEVRQGGRGPGISAVVARGGGCSCPRRLPWPFGQAC